MLRRTSHGARILEVRQPRPFPGSDLIARGSGMPLPVTFSTEDESGAGSGTDSRFSKWNEPLNVQAPANSTPIATVRDR